MLSYIRNITRRNKSVTLAEFKQSFWNNEQHKWISENQSYKRAFEELLSSFSRLESHRLQDLLGIKNLLFIPSSAHLASSISKNSRNIIIVFPDLIKLMNSAAYMRTVAIFAHELGHILCDHSNKSMTPLESQVQADQLAVELGFAKELEQVLNDYPHSIECKIRITKLTAYYLELNGQNTDSTGKIENKKYLEINN